MSVTITAATALSENGYAVLSGNTGDFALVDVEAKIDDAINQVNLFAETNITALSGTAGSKTVTLSRLESAPVKILITITLREMKKTSLSNSSSTSGSSSTNKSVSIAGVLSQSEGGSTSTAVSAAAALNSAANSPLIDMFWKAIEKLRAAETDWSQAFI
jgi:hypothetical protein